MTHLCPSLRECFLEDSSRPIISVGTQSTFSVSNNADGLPVMKGRINITIPYKPINSVGTPSGKFSVSYSTDGCSVTTQRTQPHHKYFRVMHNVPSSKSSVEKHIFGVIKILKKICKFLFTKSKEILITLFS